MPLSPTQMAVIGELIDQRLGIQLKQVDSTRVARFVEQRLSRSDHAADNYLAQLKSNHQTDAGEWQELVQCITNNESFFFRDEGLYALLQSRILPALIEQNRASRRLKIWSAACSRGEELYSIAIVLKELLPASERWTVELHGSDINENVLQTARDGIYSQWSLRGLDEGRRDQYFKPRRNGWVLDPQVRSMARFHNLNLTGDAYPDGRPWMADMDLILCRNVFIYFSADAIASTIRKLERTLRMGGLLVTGHAELNAAASNNLAIDMMPGSLVYRRAPASTAPEPVMFARINIPHNPGNPTLSGTRKAPTSSCVREAPTPRRRTLAPNNAPRPMPAPAPKSMPDQSGEASAPQALAEALQLFSTARYREAIERLPSIDTAPADLAVNTLKLVAQCWTNLGDYRNALDAVQRACALEPFSAELFYLNAHILELRGDREAATRSLDKSIYLDGEFIPAYIDLASLLELSERGARAARLRTTALQLLAALPGESEVFPYTGVNAEELCGYLKEVLGKEDSTS